MDPMLEETGTFQPAPITVERPTNLAAPAAPQNMGPMLEEVDSFQQTPAPAMSEPRSYPVIDEPEKTSNFDYPGSANSTTSIRGVTTSQETFNPIVGGYHQPLRENPAISPVAPYRDPRTIQE